MFLSWLLLVSAVTAVLSLDTSIDLMADACGGSFNETTTTGTFTATDPGPSKNCTWIIVTNRTTPMVTLQFSVLDFTGGNDSLVIIAGDNSSMTVANFTNATVPGPVTVISPAKVTKIIFQRGSGKNMTGQFSAGFNSVNCSQSISGSQGVITSPIYLNGTGNLTCTYNVTMTGNVDVPVLSFTGNFSLPNGTLNVTFWSASQNATTSLTGNKIQDDVFGLTGTQKFVLSLVIKNDSRAQKFSALFFTANKDCSGKYVAQDAASPLVFPLTQFPTTCHAQLTAAGVNETVYVSAGAQSDASILVYDGGSMNSSLIGDFNSGIWYGSSGQKLTLHADLGRAIRQQTSVLYWQQTDRAMYNVPRGQNITLALKTAATGPAESLSIQFLTDVYGQLRIQLNNNTKLSDNAYIQLQDGGQGNFGAPVFKFTADSVLFPIVSPSNRLIVKLANVTGDNVVNLTVTAINSNMGCSHIYTARSDFVTLGYTWNKTQCNAGIMAAGNMADIVTLELKSLSLCGNSTLAVYNGFNKTARLMATYNSNSPAVLRLRFPAASGARLYWLDPTGSCNKTQANLNAFYWTQSASTACGNYGNMTNGKILSPDFPQLYPLNTQCNYTLKNVTTKYMYFTVNSIQINPNHSLVLKKNGTTDMYSFRNLSSDVMVPARNLSLYFNATATDGPEGQLQDRGFNISVKSLDCGGVLTGANSTIKSPVKLNQSIDCIWIIQLPAKAVNKSVNIIAANISLTGLTNSSSNIFQVRDGGSMRDPVVTINSSTTQLLSRTNYLWIRFVSTVNKTANLKASNATTFSFSLNYTTHTCNSSSLCDNGFCMHDNWRCDGLNQCGDWSDEKYCNGSQPIPTTPAPPTPAPHAGGGGFSGVKGFWLVICILFGLVLGVVLAFLVPNLYRKFKFRSYSNFRESMAPSEA